MPINPLIHGAKEENGAVAIIVALLLVVLLGFTALGVDVAALYRERAHLQGIGDLTAMSAMAAPDAPTARAQYVLTRNGKTASAIETLQAGRFLRNPEIPIADRFTELPLGTPGINAIRVVLKEDAPLYFARVFSDESHVLLKRPALATSTGAVSFALDSHLVTLDFASLNEALTSQFGASAAINLGSMQALADASVNLGDLLTALDATTGGPRRNPAEILNVATTGANLITVLQSMLPAGLAITLAGLNGASGTSPFDVAALVGGIDTELGLTASEFLSEVELSALDIIRALINAQDATDTMTLATEIDVAGVISTQTSLTAGEPPVRSGIIALGEEGTELHHAAIRLQTDTALSPDLLTGLGASVRVASITVPIHTEVAGATATLTEIGCHAISPQDVAASFVTAATPLHPNNGTSVAALYLGQLAAGSDPINPADLNFVDLISVNITIDLPLVPDIIISGLTIQARSRVSIGASLSDTVTFTKQDVTQGETVKTFGSGTLLSSAVRSLLSPERTEFRVKPSQSGLVSPLAAPIVSNLLTVLPDRLLAGLATPIDSILDATLTDAGIKLGAGELTLIQHHCEPVRLVR